MKKIIAYGALCFGFSNVYAATDLIVAEGETRFLPAGQYEYRNISLHENSKIETDGSLTLLSETLESKKGATILYKPSLSRQNWVKNITITPFDASKVKFLTVVANGADAASLTGEPVQAAHGRNALSPNIKRLKGRSARVGQNGTNGKNGSHGEHAGNVALYLPNIKPGTKIKIIANGGNGGNGQKGGKGGNGGDGARLHPPKKGGNGGSGGKGGNGGNAGKIGVYMVVKDGTSQEKQKELLETIKIDAQSSAGARGVGGTGGDGGQGGPRGSSSHAKASDGSRGLDGDAAFGESVRGKDSKSSPSERWTVIDVLFDTQYAQKATQILSKIRAGNH